jgi:hypothetical protein
MPNVNADGDLERLADLIGRTVASHWPHLADGFRETAGRVRSILASWLERRARIVADRDLSADGRQNRLRALAAETRAAVAAFVGSTAAVLDKRREDGLAAILKNVQAPRPTDPAEALRQELRFQEIRAELRHLPRETLTMLLESPDTPQEVVSALLTAPPIAERAAPGAIPSLRPFVDPTAVRRATVARARSLSPDAAAELDSFEALADGYRQLAAFVETAVARDVPAEPSATLLAAR